MLLSHAQLAPSARAALWQPVVALHVSVVQLSLSLQSELFGVPTHAPAEQASPVVHAMLSVQPEPFGSWAVQFFVPSLHESLQLLSPTLPAQGSPPCTVHCPALLHVSVPLQKVPSSQLFPVSAGCVQPPAVHVS
jgi:hypothetical protein